MHCWGETPSRALSLVDEAVKRGPHQHITAVSVGRSTLAFLQEDGKGAFTLPKEKIRRLSCGASHIVLLSEKGKIFQLNCEDTPSIPRSPGLTDKEVIQVACGDYHSIALTKVGQVFCWGVNSKGELGLGKQVPSSAVPCLLSTLAETPLARVSAGGSHSFALTLTGVVLAWGMNSKGQLGLGDTKDRYFPTAVKSLRQRKIIHIACGEEHSAVLTKGGLVFTFGAGQYGQLGHNSAKDELWPRLVAELWGTTVTQIACGRHHTLAYVSSLKKIYACGHGKQGQLGNGLTCNQHVPLPIQQFGESHRDHCIDRIIAGGHQSFAFCSADQTSEDYYSLPEDMICALDDKIINKWLCKCDSKSWNAIKREITTIFSSASCLNGSFLKKRHHRHPTTAEVISVDLSLARLSFEKLAQKEKVLNKVQSVVLEKLLPSLSSLVAGTEGYGMYLLLPELLRVMTTHESRRDISFAFATTVLSLHPFCLATLEDLWSKLPDTFFKSLVKVFHTVSTHCLHQMRIQILTQGSNHWNLLDKILEILQKLYKVNLIGGRKIDDRNFYISEVKLLFQTLNQPHPENRTLQMMKKGLMMEIYRMTKFPCILDMDTKCMLFKFYIYFVIENNSWNPIQINRLCVNRASLLADTIQQLRKVSRNYSWPLEVTFTQENGIDHGGVSQEFFSKVAKELHSERPEMFQFFEDSRLVWFFPEAQCDADMFYLLGVLYGMALYNFCVMNLHFPLALFKKLLDVHPTLEDLEELSPVEARSLNGLLMEDADFVEELYLDFTAKGHELVPNGQEIPVTKYNRQKYVDAYVDYVFNTSVQKEFDKFAQGFCHACPNTKWKMFLPDELMAFLTGTINYEWEELEKNAKYKFYKPTDENIQNFWSVFTELSEQQKKNFLSFMTGSDRLPVGGFSKLHLTILNPNKVDPDIFYPVANTCYRILHLPNYSNIRILREKFLHAIKFYEEFGEA